MGTLILCASSLIAAVSAHGTIDCSIRGAWFAPVSNITMVVSQKSLRFDGQVAGLNNSEGGRFDGWTQKLENSGQFRLYMQPEDRSTPAACVAIETDNEGLRIAGFGTCDQPWTGTGPVVFDGA